MADDQTAQIKINNKEYSFPLIHGTEEEVAIDIRSLRQSTGSITYDDAYGNTGSCISKITFIDGEKGILRHRGYSIEELAEKSHFLESAYLIIYGELPSEAQSQAFSNKLTENAMLHEGMRQFFGAFPINAHPMAILSSLVNSLGTYHPNMASNNRVQDLELFDEAAALLISKVRTIAAMTYRTKKGFPFIYPRPDLKYVDNFLHMMFTQPYELYEADEHVRHALNLIFLLHADHEQNCSTSTVRMVASGGANLFASVSAGICALWGPLHGGANMAVIKMLEEIHASGDDGSKFIERAKKNQEKLMGFGHRVYKNYDPRAKILREAAGKVLEGLHYTDPLLDIAKHLEEKALNDDYFISRKLYPNVDFYSGIILQALGIPIDMFTVIFAIGRLPGWIAHWKEIAEDPKARIHRPRQIYAGEKHRTYIPLSERK